MNTRTIKMALMAAGFATAPMLGVAANTPAAMDRCVKAFMANLSTTMRKTPKLQESRYINDHGVSDTSTEWTLMARDAHDNHPIARALCTVNSSGQVIDLHQEPLHSLDML